MSQCPAIGRLSRLILDEADGDIADVMEVFGVKRVGRYSLRRFITKAITVETAARIHRVPVDEFIETLNKAVALQEQNENREGKTINSQHPTEN